MLVCSGPLSVLPGNSNTLWGWGLGGIGAPLRKAPFSPLPLHPGPPRTDLCPAAHCLIRSLFKEKELEEKSTKICNLPLLSC